jgi:diguanylate cyclase (GGDEF)-like protein
MRELFKKKEIYIIMLAVLIFGAVSIFSLVSIQQQAGTARVVNYAGIVRGGTQKLIKQEVYSNVVEKGQTPTVSVETRDKLIARLDGIISGMRTGEGDFNLVALPDENFQDHMTRIDASWTALKAEIMAVRDGADSTNLFKLSEDYFTLADETVSAAELFADKQVSQSRTVLLASTIVFILILILGVIYFIRMIAISRRVESLSEIAYVDYLTQIPNRTKCEETSEQYDKDKPIENIAVFMFDMNNLKTVNDKLGHKAGDNLIKEFAECLSKWADGYGFVGRFGGDEFLGIFEGTELEGAKEHLRRLQAIVDERNARYSSAIDQISYAHGFTIGNLAINDMELLTLDADRAMYDRKRQMKELS